MQLNSSSSTDIKKRNDYMSQSIEVESKDVMSGAKLASKKNSVTALQTPMALKLPKEV